MTLQEVYDLAEVLKSLKPSQNDAAKEQWIKTVNAMVFFCAQRLSFDSKEFIKACGN